MAYRPAASKAFLEPDEHRTQQLVEFKPYPLLTLPTEIMSEIFVQFLPAYPRCPPPTGLLSPTLLTHISSSWREIALSTPALWRAFSWNFETDGHADEKIELLKMWLTRSGSCPLSIEAEARLPRGTLINALLPHSERIEYARLRVSHFDPHIVPAGMPSLRQLHLTLDVENVLNALKFPSLPLLRSVQFNYTAANSIIVLPWVQLTSLSLQSVFPPGYAPILQQSVDLVHCEVAILNVFNCPDNESSVKLLCPESLVLIASSVRHGDKHYLTTFIVPRLRTLLG